MTEECLCAPMKCGECVYYNPPTKMCESPESDHYGHTIPPWHPIPFIAHESPGELLHLELPCFQSEEMLEQDDEVNA